jgi:hypothetical protein
MGNGEMKKNNEGTGWLMIKGRVRTFQESSFDNPTDCPFFPSPFFITPFPLSNPSFHHIEKLNSQ